MKINFFLKNIISNIISSLITIIFLKIILLFSDEDIVSNYFKIKAFGLIIFSLSSIRFPDLLFNLFGSNKIKYLKLRKLHHSFSLILSSFYYFIIYFL